MAINTKTLSMLCMAGLAVGMYHADQREEVVDTEVVEGDTHKAVGDTHKAVGDKGTSTRGGKGRKASGAWEDDAMTSAVNTAGEKAKVTVKAAGTNASTNDASSNDDDDKEAHHLHHAHPKVKDFIKRHRGEGATHTHTLDEIFKHHSVTESTVNDSAHTKHHCGGCHKHSVFIKLGANMVKSWLPPNMSEHVDAHLDNITRHIKSEPDHSFNFTAINSTAQDQFVPPGHYGSSALRSKWCASNQLKTDTTSAKSWFGSGVMPIANTAKEASWYANASKKKCVWSSILMVFDGINLVLSGVDLSKGGLKQVEEEFAKNEGEELFGGAFKEGGVVDGLWNAAACGGVLRFAAELFKMIWVIYTNVASVFKYIMSAYKNEFSWWTIWKFLLMAITFAANVLVWFATEGVALMAKIVLLAFSAFDFIADIFKVICHCGSNSAGMCYFFDSDKCPNCPYAV